MQLQDPNGSRVELGEFKSTGAVSRGLTGCVLVLSSFFAVGCAFGVVVGVMVSLWGSQPGQSPIFLAVMSGGILGAISAFFTMVSMRLFSTLRGHPVPYLMPPALAVILALVLGLAGVGVFVASFSTHHDRSYSGFGASLTFLAFSFASIRTWLWPRKNASSTGEPGV